MKKYREVTSIGFNIFYFDDQVEAGTQEKKKYI